jgi:hypothetical protein
MYRASKIDVKEREKQLSSDDDEFNDNQSEITSSTESGIEVVNYNPGNLVWAKVTGHPWWPCVISRDGNDGDSYFKSFGSLRTKRMFYVEFFGPSSEHAWICEGSLLEYKGIEAFKAYAQDQVDEAPTKSQKEKLAERFQLKVSLKRRENWERAVEEADEILNKNCELEILFFFNDF